MTAPVQPTPEELALAQVAQAQQDQLRAQLLQALLLVYGATQLQAPLPNPDQLIALVRQMVPPTLGAQRAMVALTTTQLQRQSQTPIVVNSSDVIGARLRGGVPIEQVYMRPFTEIRHQLDIGKTPDEAFRIGQQRLIKTAETDLQLAKTHASRDFAVKLQERHPGTIVGFRRVLSSKPNHCALCILASTRRYHSFDLLPIHPGCGCGVALIIGDEDPGAFIDDQRVQDLHAIVERDLGKRYVKAGGNGDLAAYRDILITETHGELGPVLAVRGHDFSGPNLRHRETPPSAPVDHEVIGHTRVNPAGDAPRSTSKA